MNFCPLPLALESRQVCNVVDDKLYFYYTAFQGNESNLNPLQYWSGLYANASTGLAVLRRDGFASMEADEQGGFLLTRPVTFSGKHLFVNVHGPRGRLQAEVCTEYGKPMEGFSRDECQPVSADSTKQMVAWKNGDSLESIAGKTVRFKSKERACQAGIISIQKTLLSVKVTVKDSNPQPSDPKGEL